MKYQLHYTLIDELQASPTSPLSPAARDRMFGRMLSSLRQIETADKPGYADWKACWDVYELMKSLVETGVCEDPGKLLEDAMLALALAGHRHLEKGAPIRLDAQGIQDMRALMASCIEIAERVPARVMLHVHRHASKRMQRALAGKNTNLMKLNAERFDE